MTSSPQIDVAVKGDTELLGKTPAEIEHERKRLLILAFSTLGSIFLFTFGITALLDSRFILACLVLSVLVVAILIAVYIRKKSANVRATSFFVASILFFLSSFLLLNGGAEGTGVYWTYPLSALMVLLLGARAGSIYMGLFLSANATLMFGSFTFVYQYSAFEGLRILATLLALYSLTLASEWIRTRSYGAISQASESHRHRANTDPLTGLLNRYGVSVYLRAKNMRSSACVVLLDIDNFKNLNDQFGHDRGDFVLKKLSEVLKGNTKGADLVSRWGGEEFLLIFFDTPVDSAECLMNKIRREFSDIVFDQNEHAIRATFSAGLAEMTDPDEFESTVSLADKRLYAAKYSGRNKILAFE